MRPCATNLANQHCPTAAQGNCSLDPSLDQQVPIDGAHGATIISSLGSSGTGTIDHAAIQTSTQLVPYGVTEDPGSPHFASGVAELIAGDTGDQSAIPVAPLDRALIEALDTINLVYTE